MFFKHLIPNPPLFPLLFSQVSLCNIPIHRPARTHTKVLFGQHVTRRWLIRRQPWEHNRGIFPVGGGFEDNFRYVVEKSFPSMVDSTVTFGTSSRNLSRRCLIRSKLFVDIKAPRLLTSFHAYMDPHLPLASPLIFLPYSSCLQWCLRHLNTPVNVIWEGYNTR
jgi:hypothetical protein